MPRHARTDLRRNGWRACAALAIALQGTAQAQIVADPQAPGAQRPTVLSAPNGVPLVNIQTPSAAGVSRNLYRRFDVMRAGAILNNSRLPVQTQLGGWVPANPWLATGPARVILNEVNSADPSLLQGWVEVAGPRAELVIANPAGIQVNGAGFINASRLTLTTGTPLLQGGALDAYRVQRGAIGIGGEGLDARGADSTAILARAVTLNARLWAQRLQLVTGANTVAAEDASARGAATPLGEAPRLALDVAELGGMYAGHIRLIGTEAGVGVNSLGVLSAEAGDLVLEANGWLHNGGGLYASGALQLQAAGPLTQAAGGEMVAQRLSLGAGGAIAAQGRLASGEDMALAAARLDLHSATLGAGGRLSLVTGGALNTDGATLQAGGIQARAAAVSNRGGRWAQVGTGSGISVLSQGLFDNREGRVLGAGSLQLSARGLDNEGGRLAVAGDGEVRTQRAALQNRGGLIGAQGALRLHSGELFNTGQLLAQDLLSIDADTVHNSGTLEAGQLALRATGLVHNAAGASLLAGQFLAVEADTLDNQGLIDVAAGGDGGFQARVGTFNNRSGGAVFADRIAIEAQTLNNRPDPGQGQGELVPVIAARGDLQLGLHTLNNEDGALLYSGGALGLGGSLYGGAYAIGSADAVNNLSATIEAQGGLDLSARSLLNQRRGVSLSTVPVLDQSAELAMPSWWVNGKNQFGAPIEATSNYAPLLYYLVDPAAILSEQAIVTPDGNRLRRIELALHPRDSVFFAASGAYAGYRGVRERVAPGAAATVVLYASERRDGVANPDQVPGAPEVFGQALSAVTEWQSDTLSYGPEHGRCSTACTLLVVQPGFSDPLRDLLRSDQTYLVPLHPGLEVARSARHTAVEDRLDPGAGEAAAIRAGGDMRLDLGESLLNRYGDILAGGVLRIDGPASAVHNEGAELKRTHRFAISSHTAGMGSFDWVKPDISETIGAVPARLSGNQGLLVQARDLSNTSQGRTTGLVGAGQPFVGAQLPQQPAPLVLPDSRLFRRASPGLGYLVETDPMFTGRRPWLGSDYLLQHWAADPALTLKRVGDGFVEQKLVREQIAQLSGRRYLGEVRDDEAQFRALMDSGLAYAKAFGLKPGIALTAEQMAQLTTDLIWLVQQDVVLADGTRTQALVPRVYLRAVPPDELLPSGAVLAGKKVVLDIQQDLLNAGGRIEGGAVLAQAGRDLSNIGGLMQARSELLASAGRNLTISSPTHSTGFSGEHVQQNRTELAGLGAVRVTGDEAGARLSLSAGQDLVLQGASVSNASQGGSTRLDAGRDVLLQTVTVGSGHSVTADERNHRRASESQELGSDIVALGDVRIDAGRDVAARTAGVQALGDVAVQAGRDIRLEAGRALSESESSVHQQRSGLLSKKSREEAQSAASNVALGSSLVGANVVMEAGRDIEVKGSEVDAQHLLLLDAQRDVVIASEENHSSRADFTQVRKSGLEVNKQGIDHARSARSGSQSIQSSTQAGSSLSGGEVLIFSGRDTAVRASTIAADGLLGISAGRDVNIVAGTDSETREQSQQGKRQGVNVMASGLSESITFLEDGRDQGSGRVSTQTAAASVVGSLGGDVQIRAAHHYQQTGSDVLALAGDVDIRAQSGEIVEARETRSSREQTSQKSTTLGATPRHALIDLAKSAKSTAQAAQAITDTGDGRVQALGAAATALGAASTAAQAAALMANPQSLASVTIDFNLGSERSRSETTESVDAGRASTVTAAGDVRIRALGAGERSDLLIRGSEVRAGGDVLLKAEGGVRLESAEDRTGLHSQSDNSGASIGIGVSLGASSGITFNLAAHRGQGAVQAEQVEQRNTRIVAGQTARVESGGDTTLAGAVIAGHSVQADVGGKLLIESRQDSSHLRSEQQSSGFDARLCIPPFCFGASSVGVSDAAQNVQSDYVAVKEQSGIRAGDAGFQLDVKGDTVLKSGVITSTEQALQDGKNRFERGGELVLSDIENHARYEGRGHELNVAVAVEGPGQAPQTPAQQARGPAVPAKNEGGAGLGADSGEAHSTSKAGISGMAGDASARTGAAEAGLAPIFDQAKVQKELDAQIKITAEFGKGASKAVGDYATQRYGELKDTDPEEAAKWAEGGVYRSMVHAVVGGLTGGAAGAAGAGAAALSADALNRLTADMPEGVRNAVGATIAAGIGAVAGGTAGATAAFNADLNNRQLHPTEAQWIKDNAKRFAQQQGISEEEAQQQLARQAYRQVQYGAEGEWDAAASAFLSHAKGMLPADGNSGPGYMFFATPDQKAAMQMYVGTLPALADFYIHNGLKLPDAQAVASSLAKDSRQRELYAGLTVGAGAASSVLALAAVSPSLLTWALVNPEKAVQTGLITAETAAGIASGAITPASMTEALGQNLGRALSATEKAAVLELSVTLKAVAQQKAVVVQEQRVGELVTLFNKQSSADDLVLGGKSYVATTNPAGTTKTFDTSGLSAADLDKQVFGYANELAAGRQLEAVDVGVWTAKLDNGTIINVRSISSSNVSRWTMDVQGSPQLRTLRPDFVKNSYEIKFK